MHCKSCRFGRYHAVDQTYMSQYDDQFLIINNAPAHRCDLCGDTRFDDAFTKQLRLFLDELVSRAPQKNEPFFQEINPHLQFWYPARRSS